MKHSREHSANKFDLTTCILSFSVSSKRELTGSVINRPGFRIPVVRTSCGWAVSGWLLNANLEAAMGPGYARSRAAEALGKNHFSEA